MAERGTPITTCTNHCSACRLHFHSLAAFEAHRRGFACLAPADLVDLTGRDRLEVLTEHGECRMYETVERDVTIWTMAGSRERIAHWRENAPVGSSPAA